MIDVSHISRVSRFHCLGKPSEALVTSHRVFSPSLPPPVSTNRPRLSRPREDLPLVTAWRSQPEKHASIPLALSSVEHCLFYGIVIGVAKRLAKGISRV